MRVAIATDWFAPRRGGVEAQLLRLAEGLGARGHAVDVLTTMPGARDGVHFRVRRLEAVALPGLSLALTPALPRALRRELLRGYDVVHSHVSVVSPVGYTAALVARALETPTVVTFHSVLRAKTYLLRAVSLFPRLTSGASAPRWTGVSALVASQLRRALGRHASVAVLPNGIDLAFWRAAARTPRSASSGLTLVYAGRLHRKKRPRELVEAFARAARATDMPVTLRLVGEGPERAGLERDARALGAGSPGPARVILSEWLAPEALREVYAGADAFVSAAIRESFGIAVLEARAAGLPVIAMRAAGSSDFLDDDTALLCATDEDLARQIERFISEAALRRQLASASGALARYDWSSVLDQHEIAYGLAMTGSARAAEAVVV